MRLPAFHHFSTRISCPARSDVLKFRLCELLVLKFPFFFLSWTWFTVKAYRARTDRLWCFDLGSRSLSDDHCQHENFNLGWFTKLYFFMVDKLELDGHIIFGIRYVAYNQSYANDESRLDVANAIRFGVLALKFFQVEFFQVFWCYMRIAYLSAGLLKVLQVVYGDLRYVTSLEKIQTQNTFENLLKTNRRRCPVPQILIIS